MHNILYMSLLSWIQLFYCNWYIIYYICHCCYFSTFVKHRINFYQIFKIHKSDIYLNRIYCTCRFYSLIWRMFYHEFVSMTLHESITTCNKFEMYIFITVTIILSNLRMAFWPSNHKLLLTIEFCFQETI